MGENVSLCWNFAEGTSATAQGTLAIAVITKHIKPALSYLKSMENFWRGTKGQDQGKYGDGHAALPQLTSFTNFHSAVLFFIF